MNAKKFMDAVGNISDENIAKYADVTPVVVKGKPEKEVKGMKKISIWLSAAAAALVLGVGIFAAAHFAKGPEHGSHTAYLPTAEPTETATATETEPFSTQSTPPELLSFSGIEEYRKFAEAAKLNEESFESFLDEHSTYYMNGICTKQDALNALEVLKSIPTPVIEGYELSRIELSYYNDSVRSIYRSGAHYISFAFTITCSDEDAESRIRGSEHELIEIDAGDFEEIRYLLRVITDEDMGPNAYYYANIRSHKTFLITDIGEEELLSLLRSCSFVSIGEYSGSTDR